jgi:hypothetical protein
MLETVLALTPKNFSMIPGTVTEFRLRYSFAKHSARNMTPIPFAIVYHAPERPKSKPYSDTPVVAVPPSHSPVEAATMAKMPSSAPWNESEVFDLFIERTPMTTVAAMYSRIIIN